MSSKPWWYVKGRKDLIENRISKRREREIMQQENASRNDKYFQRWRLQNQFYDQWAKYGLNSAKGGDALNGNSPLINAPYDLHYDPFDTPERQTKLMQIKDAMDSELRNLWDQLRVLEREAVKKRQQESDLWQEIKDLIGLKTCLDFHRETWEIKGLKCRHKRFAKDKLRLKTFHNYEQLSYYQLCIQTVAKSQTNHLITEDEEIQLRQLVESALNIIHNYIALNERRNAEFFVLYNEEAERRLASQERQWQREKKVWVNLVDNILESYFLIYKAALERLIQEQEDNLLKRRSQTQALKDRSEQIRSDIRFKSLLDSSIRNLGAMDLQT